ncbi:tripartite tricarboxylate transporter substrate binding protein [Halarsenatibacter silvermanii]|uniref:Tripartite-type tricarboxylate transporter, receptor component TctC n=1 Tax=Halarsenatibacter silvermanii TaxID=321763 RepID=A0A1G9TWU7_9FIRM|nr:tripartite tricarboxylate transporter substrate binding protein [Halarsenatibacter silvermanii]SDM52058.1 Tripartite-type tricarboxylate transporter, receptor component TctC [Halarsenatibacter silvermanii]
MFNITIKKVLVITLALLVSFGLGFSENIHADEHDDFPEEELELTVIVAEGGGSDMTLRALADATEDILGEPIVVTNVPGAGGAVGYEEFSAYAEPDGHELVFITESMYTTHMVNPDLDYTYEDFEPVITVNFDPAALIVPSDSPYDDLEEFVEYAEENPGVITLGNSGHGNIWHLSATAFEQAAGINVNQVPFDGAAPTMAATVGGHIDAMIASPPEVVDQVEAGDLEILGIMADERDPNFPEVPTMKEKGYDIEIGTWRGVGVPAGTPDEIIEKLHDAFREGMQKDSFVNFMEEQGLGIIYRGPEETAEYIEEDVPRFRELLKELDLYGAE